MPLEIYAFTTADGKTLTMDNEVYSIQSMGVFGAPPTNYITRQSYKQHGVTEVDFLLQPRSIEVEFWRKAACNRQTYWANRAALLEFFRPNRNGQMTFTIVQPDNSQRAIKIRPNPGPQYPFDENNHWDIRETLTFTADDPIWYDPTATTVTFSSSSATDLVFPATFPIRFGPAGLQFGSVITYLGSWQTYPRITLTGPYTSVAITTSVSAAAIFLTVGIAAGEQRIIDLTPGSQTVLSATSENKFSDLGPLSDLVNFSIRPTPEAPNGVQTLTIAMTGGVAGVSSASVSYNNRYFGI